MVVCEAEIAVLIFVHRRYISHFREALLSMVGLEADDIAAVGHADELRSGYDVILLRSIF